eukprot:6825108-Alexandrium_andersonii.AAC.1
MSASLVGSEMCIRDRCCAPWMSPTGGRTISFRAAAWTAMDATPQTISLSALKAATRAAIRKQHLSPQRRPRGGTRSPRQTASGCVAAEASFVACVHKR